MERMERAGWCWAHPVAPSTCRAGEIQCCPRRRTLLKGTGQQSPDLTANADNLDDALLSYEYLRPWTTVLDVRCQPATTPSWW